MQRPQRGEETQGTPRQHVGGAHASVAVGALVARRLAIGLEHGQRLEAGGQRLLHGGSVIAGVQPLSGMREGLVDGLVGLPGEMILDACGPQQGADQGGAQRPETEFGEPRHGDVEDAARGLVGGNHHDQHRGHGAHDAAVGEVVAQQRTAIGAEHDPQGQRDQRGHAGLGEEGHDDDAGQRADEGAADLADALFDHHAAHRPDLQERRRDQRPVGAVEIAPQGDVQRQQHRQGGLGGELQRCLRGRQVGLDPGRHGRLSLRPCRRRHGSWPSFRHSAASPRERRRVRCAPGCVVPAVPS